MSIGPDALAPVRAYRVLPEHRVVGLMTGTSADAVDAALVRFDGSGLEATHTIEAYRETPLDPALRREVLEVASAATLPPERLMRLDAALGELYAASVLELLGAAGVDPRSVDAIGSHGQTVRHVPRKEGGGEAFTLQLGAPAVIAERTGITVVSDFRSRDTAAGGEGAPLVPIADWWLFRSSEEARVLLNLGGMANVTFLPKNATLADLIAFDTGPGNAVMDALAGLLSGGSETQDRGGERAARGRPDDALVAEMLADPFFALAPPRSTGREHFGQRYAETLMRLGRGMGLSDDDLLATAVEITAASAALAIHQFLAPLGGVDAAYASGGGVHNAALMEALARRLGSVRLERLARLGVAPEAKEALAFAFLAHLTLSGRPGNVPGATGAAHPAVLGSVTPGRVA